MQEKPLPEIRCCIYKIDGKFYEPGEMVKISASMFVPVFIKPNVYDVPSFYIEANGALGNWRAFNVHEVEAYLLNGAWELADDTGYEEAKRHFELTLAKPSTQSVPAPAVTMSGLFRVVNGAEIVIVADMDLAEASDKASSLASNNPGSEYYVLAPVAKYVADKPVVTVTRY